MCGPARAAASAVCSATRVRRLCRSSRGASHASNRFSCSASSSRRSLPPPPPLAAAGPRLRPFTSDSSRQAAAAAVHSGGSSIAGSQQAMPARAMWTAAAAQEGGGASGADGGPPVVLLLDVMDTVVYDPFFQDMPRFFGCTFKELLAAKHPTAWVEFERAQISEAQLFQRFFADGRPVDGEALKAHMAGCYRYLDGMESLLGRLQDAGVPMHAFSNYPSWWELIEERLALSRYLRWTFISCEGPLKGLRKPSAESYAAVVDHLGVPPDRLLFVDDRQANVDGALAAGIPAVRFTDAQQLEAELRVRGVLL